MTLYHKHLTRPQFNTKTVPVQLAMEVRVCLHIHVHCERVFVCMRTNLNR